MSEPHSLPPKSDWKVVQWDSLAVLANSEVSKFIGAIPIVGYLILYNDGIAEFLSFKQIAGQEERFFLTGILKLRLSFFGSFFILFSVVVFRFNRPSCLAIAANEMSFADNVYKSYSRGEIVKMESEVSSSKWVKRTSLLNEQLKQSNSSTSRYTPIFSKKTTRDEMSGIHSNYVRLLSREWRAGAMHERASARWIVFSLLGLGYLMLLAPSLDILQAVSRDVLADVILSRI